MNPIARYRAYSRWEDENPIKGAVAAGLSAWVVMTAVFLIDGTGVLMAIGLALLAGIIMTAISYSSSALSY